MSKKIVHKLRTFRSLTPEGVSTLRFIAPVCDSQLLYHWPEGTLGSHFWAKVNCPDCLKTRTRRVNKKKNDAFMQGFGVAVAVLAGKTFDEPTLAKELASQCGFSLKTFEEAGCDEDDIKVIRDVFVPAQQRYEKYLKKRKVK